MSATRSQTLGIRDHCVVKEIIIKISSPHAYACHLLDLWFVNFSDTLLIINFTGYKHIGNDM